MIENNINSDIQDAIDHSHVIVGDFLRQNTSVYLRLKIHNIISFSSNIGDVNPIFNAILGVLINQTQKL